MSESDAAALTTPSQYADAVARAHAAAAAYYDSDTLLMDDATYDALVRTIEAAEATHPDWLLPDSPTGKVAGGASTGGDVPHTVPCLSLDNVFSAAELGGWVDTLARKLGRPAGGFTVEPKMDGMAICARYRDGRLDKLVTRGDGLAGEDVTFAASAIVGLPDRLTERVDVEIRGEVLLTEAQKDAANELRIAHGDTPFVNARNGTAGALRGAKGREYVIPLTFFAYQVVHLGSLFDGVRIDQMRHSAAMAIVERLGVQTTGQSAAGMAVCPDLAGVLAYVAALETGRPDLGFGVDGAVIKADDPGDRDEAGFSSRAPRWGIAYKYPAEEAITTLEEVLWQVGRTGVITPRARVTPTFVAGTTITYATLHNPEDIVRKGFLLYDKVTVHRAGEVIPRLEAPVVNLRTGDEVPIEVPQTCPRCGGEIDRSQARWRCARGRYCGLAESIRYAVSRDCLDIEGMGDKVVTQLVDKQLVGDVADLFTLTRAQLLSLDRMGETSVDKLLEQLDGAKSRPLSRVFCSLGVRMTGRSMSRRLARHFGSMDALVAAGVAELEAVDGVGPERASTIVDELTDIGPVIAKLAAAGVNLLEPTTTATADSSAAGGSGQPFAGLTVVVSGTVPGLSRNEANEWVEKLGGKSSGSVSKNTSLLVAGDGAGSKVTKAESLNVKVMPAEEFAKVTALPDEEFAALVATFLTD